MLTALATLFSHCWRSSGSMAMALTVAMPLIVSTSIAWRLALGVVEGVQPALEGDDQHADDHGDHRGEDQDDTGQSQAVEEQKGQEDKERGGLQHGEKDIAGEKIADLGGLLHMLGQHPGGDMLEKIERQVEQMAEGPAGDPQIDLVGGMQQQIIAEEIEPGVDRQGHRHAHPEDMQGGEGLIDQDLVDDDLEKDRGDQGNGVDEQDRQGDIDKGESSAGGSRG